MTCTVNWLLAVLRSRSIIVRLWLRVFFSPAPAPIKKGFKPNYFFLLDSSFLTRKMSFIFKYRYSSFKQPFINVGTNEENIIENFVGFISGGAGARPLNQLRPKSTGSATLIILHVPSSAGIKYLLTFLRYLGTFCLLRIRIKQSRIKIRLQDLAKSADPTLTYNLQTNYSNFPWSKN